MKVNPYRDRLVAELHLIYRRHGIYWRGGEDCGWRCDHKVNPVIIQRLTRLRKLLAMINGEANIPAFIYDDISRPSQGDSWKSLMKLMDKAAIITRPIY